MRPLQKIIPIVATGSVLVALGITAIPMLSVWRAPEAAQPPTIWSLSSEPDATPNEIVVELRDNADATALDRTFGIMLKPNSMEAVNDHIFIADLAPTDDETALIARLKADSRVVAAEPDFTVSVPEGSAQSYRGEGVSPEQQPNFAEIPLAHGLSSAEPASPDDNRLSAAGAPNDPRYGEQWNFRMIGVEDAWKRTTGKGVIVAVVDTGVAVGNSAKGKTCRDFGQTAIVKGYNFVDRNDDAYDDHGHGTHVAGTIAESTNNNEGVAGIAYGATILPVKVLSATGSGTAAGVADGIRFAADKGAKIINMSLGSSRSSDVIHNACKYAVKKGVVIVCAAGNGFGEPVGYPAAYPECIAVSSVGPTRKIAKYSSYGRQVALAAPGGDMMESGDPADGILQNTNYPESQGGRGDDYYAFQGTSMACPHVAGVAALIEAQGITDPARVRELLTQTAVPNGDTNKYGAGILSAARATERAAQETDIKVRHLVFFGAALLLLGVGGRRKQLSLRLVMAAALGLGMFAPDWFSSLFGADSALNLLTFSALAPILFFLALRRGPGVKIAGMLSLGIAMNLYANWHNGTLPFTSATFADRALPWTMANLGAALAIGCAAALRAYRATRTR
jgi:serine protease